MSYLSFLCTRFELMHCEVKADRQVTDRKEGRNLYGSRCSEQREIEPNSFLGSRMHHSS